MRALACTYRAGSIKEPHRVSNSARPISYRGISLDIPAEVRGDTRSRHLQPKAPAKEIQQICDRTNEVAKGCKGGARCKEGGPAETAISIESVAGLDAEARLAGIDCGRPARPRGVA